MSKYKIKRLSYVEFDHEPTPDELIHFKYIKREKVNGKWRYWYEDAKNAVKDAVGITAKENLITAKSNLDAAKARDEAAAKSMVKLRRYYTNAVKRVEKNMPNDAIDYSIKLYNIAEKASAALRQNNRDEYARLEDEFMNTLNSKANKGRYYKQLRDESIPRLKQMSDKATDTATQRTRERVAAGKAYAKAQKAYLDTPLYKLEKARDDVKVWVNNTIRNIKKRK